MTSAADPLSRTSVIDAHPGRAAVARVPDPEAVEHETHQRSENEPHDVCRDVVFEQGGEPQPIVRDAEAGECDAQADERGGHELHELAKNVLVTNFAEGPVAVTEPVEDDGHRCADKFCAEGCGDPPGVWAVCQSQQVEDSDVDAHPNETHHAELEKVAQQVRPDALGHGSRRHCHGEPFVSGMGENRRAPPATRPPVPVKGTSMTRVVGVIGGGQLARMMTPPAINLGLEIYVLAKESSESAKIAVTALGDHTDTQALLNFARECDVVTFDHEHVPQSVLTELVAAGVNLQPKPEALLYAQDKLLMRKRLAELGVPIPGWAEVTTVAEVDAFVAEYGGRAVVKTARGGYDGKGVRVVSSGTEVADWFAALAQGEALLVEEFVSFTRELAQMIARRPSGEVALWPVVETMQANGVCAEVIAPAPSSAGKVADMAADIATTIAHGLDVTGVFAVEMFETTDDRILVNELAMRPHNSGHWSQDGSLTSQFEQHLRAVLDLPLGATAMVAQWAVMSNILGGPASGDLDAASAQLMAEYPEAKLHLYGKSPRPGRKIGHVNVIGDELDRAVAAARGATAFFQD